MNELKAYLEASEKLKADTALMEMIEQYEAETKQLIELVQQPDYDAQEAIRLVQRIASGRDSPSYSGRSEEGTNNADLR